MSTDLKRRNVPFSPPDMTEQEAEEVKQAILSGWITTGPRTKKLEKVIDEYVNQGKVERLKVNGEPQKTPNCVCLNSATAAMEMVLHVLGVGPGDEVIMPAYTYTASASVVDHVGATIRMVDIRPAGGSEDTQDFEMDYEKLAEAITERTKVIVPVDLAGICANVDRILEVVNRPEIGAKFRPSNDIQRAMGRIFVSNDCAHSFGAWRGGKMAGAIADFSSFSFHAVKNFTTAEGGAMTWNLPFGNDTVPGRQVYCGSPVPYIEGETWNEFVYRLSQLFSLHGQNKDALAKTKLGAWEYDIIGPWYKCNMTDVMAAMGLVQFERYPEMLAKRRRYIERYDEAFNNLNVDLNLNGKGIELRGLKHYTDPSTGSGQVQHAGSGHLYILRILGMNREQVNGVIEKMAERGIATNVHYKPLPMMTAYKAKGIDIKDYPNAYKFFENEITLPLNTRMTEEDVEYVIENLIEILKGE